MSKARLPLKERTRTGEQRAADDAALLAEGEPLATIPELAAMLGVSGNAFRWVLQRDAAPLVRYVSTTHPVRFCVAEARVAVEAARPELDARRRRAEGASRARAIAAVAAEPVTLPCTRVEVRATAPRPNWAQGETASRLRHAPGRREKQTGPEIMFVRRPGGR